MSTFDRMEIIEEIRALSAELGVTDLPIMQKLENLVDQMLVWLRDALEARAEECRKMFAQG